MIKVLIIFGTRPEAIKLCPVVKHLAQRPESFDVGTCVTAQHRELLDQVLEVFGVAPDYDLDLMRPGQSLAQTAARIIAGLEPVLRDAAPDIVLVQGDTTTTFCGALGAFYERIPVGHVEAGLRTGDLLQPYPEELNRVLTTRVATLHFAATEWAASNLRREGVSGEVIHITGNPGIDAVLDVAGRLASGELVAPRTVAIPPGKRLVLVTAHRRESFGKGFEGICAGLAAIARRDDAHVVYPVHPNPSVRRAVEAGLGGSAVERIDPLDYLSFVDLMRRADILLTDSGGIQEEGPALAKPVLVMRDKTERPEAVEAGTAKLVGTDRDRIAGEVARLLESPKMRLAMASSHNPYGDGRASLRIANAILSFFKT